MNYNNQFINPKDKPLIKSQFNIGINSLKPSLFAENDKPFDILNDPEIKALRQKVNNLTNKYIFVNPYNNNNNINRNSSVNNNANKDLFDIYNENLKQARTINILGYGLQALNALGDYIGNVNKNPYITPDTYIPERVQYIPTTTDNFDTKLSQIRSMYMKYLRNTGNTDAIPSLYSLEDKAIENAANIAAENNKAKMRAEEINADLMTKAMQLNIANKLEADKLNTVFAQQKQQALTSNKEALFGALGGIAGMYNKANEQKFTADIIKSIKEKYPDLYEKIIYSKFNFGDDNFKSKKSKSNKNSSTEDEQYNITR